MITEMIKIIMFIVIGVTGLSQSLLLISQPNTILNILGILILILTIVIEYILLKLRNNKFFKDKKSINNNYKNLK